MWIPTPSITSAFAAATGASTSASNEQLASAFARSLLSRSKHSPQRTWLQRLKRDSWTTHLSGAISSDSLGESFTDWWTSCLAATRASHSAQPANDSAPKTQGTSGRLSQPELLQCDQQYVSLRMSRDISRWGCPTLSKTWADWVTERRGAWRARVNAARLTRGSGSSSWPTMHMGSNERGAYYDKTGKGQRYLSDAVVDEQKNWPTATSQDGKQGGITPFQAKGGNHTNLLHVAAINEEQKNWPTMGTTQAHISGQGSSTIEEVAKQRTFHLKQRTNKHGEIVARKGGKTHQATLASAVVGVQNWPTANARDWKDSITGTHPPSRPNMSEQTLGQAVSVMHGQAAPASNSSLGSRQGLWPTPCANNPNEGETLESWDRRQALNKAKHNNGNGAGTPLAIKVKQELWPTARSLDGSVNESLETWTARHHRKEAEGINLHRPLPIAVMQEQAKTQDFPTPRTCDWKSSPNADSNIKRMEVGQATLAEFVHAKHKKGDLWSTPRTGATESSRPNNKGGIPLADQAKREQWATPQAHDAQGPKTPKQIAVMRAKGHGVKNLNEQREYKELTPMVERHQSGKLNPRWVETLMGLPIGWTMPSCTSPVTIELMSCGASGTELFRPLRSVRGDFLLAS